MEKQKAENILYGLGALCMLLSVSCIVFFFYIAPNVVFDFHYEVPEFIAHFTHWYEHHHDAGGFMLALGVLAPFLVGGILFGLIAKSVSSHFDKEELGANPRGEETIGLEGDAIGPSESETKTVLVRTMILIGLLIAGLVLIEFLIYEEAPTEPRQIQITTPRT